LETEAVEGRDMERPEGAVDMITIQQLENGVRQLSPEELAAFRAWFAEFDAGEWDRQFEADVSAGRLDWLLEEGRRDSREGLGLSKAAEPPKTTEVDRAGL
jgi:hypothetical protein